MLPLPLRERAGVRGALLIPSANSGFPLKTCGNDNGVQLVEMTIFFKMGMDDVFQSGKDDGVQSGNDDVFQNDGTPGKGGCGEVEKSTGMTMCFE